MRLENDELDNILSFTAELGRLKELDPNFWERVFECLSELFGYRRPQFFPYADRTFGAPLGRTPREGATPEQMRDYRLENDYWLKHYSALDPFNPANTPSRLKNQRVILLKDVAREFEAPGLTDYVEYRRRNEVTDQMTTAIYSEGDLRGCLVVSRGLDEPKLTERDRTLFGALTVHLEARVNTLSRIAGQKLEIQFLEAVMDRVDEGIAFLDTRYRVAYCNRTAGRLLLSLTDTRDLDCAAHTLVTRRILPGRTAALGRYSLRLVPAVVPAPVGEPGVMYVLHISHASDAPPPVEEAADRYRLTAREAEVLEMILTGSSNQQIAEALYISLPTVKTHVSNIFRKMGVTRRMELADRLRRPPEGAE